MAKVYIIGIGPGRKEYLLPIALREIKKTDCLIGAKRVLSLFGHLNKEKIYLQGHFDQAINYIEKNRDKKKIALLVSGDPGLYSLLGKIQSTFKKEDYVVLPGISTMQLAFARLGEYWQDAKIISLHARKLNGLSGEIRNLRKVFLFTDTKFSPEKIAARLLREGIENRKAIVFENLAYPNERIVDTDLKALSKMNGFGLCVMLIKK